MELTLYWLIFFHVAFLIGTRKVLLHKVKVLHLLFKTLGSVTVFVIFRWTYLWSWVRIPPSPFKVLRVSHYPFLLIAKVSPLCGFYTAQVPRFRDLNGLDIFFHRQLLKPVLRDFFPHTGVILSGRPGHFLPPLSQIIILNRSHINFAIDKVLLRRQIQH